MHERSVIVSIISEWIFKNSILSLPHENLNLNKWDLITILQYEDLITILQYEDYITLI